MLKAEKCNELWGRGEVGEGEVVGRDFGNM